MVFHRWIDIQLTISCVLTTIESDISFETLLSQNSSAFALYLLCCVFIIPICKKLYLFSVLVCVLQVTKLRAFISQCKQVRLHTPYKHVIWIQLNSQINCFDSLKVHCLRYISICGETKPNKSKHDEVSGLCSKQHVGGKQKPGANILVS